MTLSLALIGHGAIATHVRRHLQALDARVDAVVMRPARIGDRPKNDPVWVSNVADLPPGIDLVIDCAGHEALQAHGAAVLTAGLDLVSVSLGALADDALAQRLRQASANSGARLHLASGAIGGLDVLRAAATGGLETVRYTGRKPPKGWRGSPADDVLDLDALTTGAATHFAGTARQAALAYPKNANVAAAVALAGVGFDKTEVMLIADADVTHNIHEVHATGDFGELDLRIKGAALPENPRSSALAAMSVISAVLQRQDRIHF